MLNETALTCCCHIWSCLTTCLLDNKSLHWMILWSAHLIWTNIKVSSNKTYTIFGLEHLSNNLHRWLIAVWKKKVPLTLRYTLRYTFVCRFKSIECSIALSFRLVCSFMLFFLHSFYTHTWTSGQKRYEMYRFNLISNSYSKFTFW